MISTRCRASASQVVVSSFVFGLSFSAAAQGLTPLSELEMEGVFGQEGILISIDYYYNSEKTSDPATSGRRLDDFCANPNGAGSLANMNCRMAIQLENISDSWLVIKNGHASLSVNRLSFDAAFLGEAGSSANIGFYNDAKFRMPDELGGECLLETLVCDPSTISTMPALRTHYPDTGGSYSTVTRTSSGFNDVKLGVYYEGMAVEFNSPLNEQNGWGRNVNGSFLGLNIADNNGNQAGIAFGGDFYLYGF